MVEINPILDPAIERTERRTLGSAEFDEARRATWLQSPYSADTWQVADTDDARNVETIRFDYLLADGRSLVEAPRLYATVKEYAWFIRDPRFGEVDKAKTHASLVRHLMHIAHALTLRGLDSFKYLVEYDFELLTEACRYGVDSILDAPKRVEAYLAALAESGNSPPCNVRLSGKLRDYSTKKIVAACNLPEVASHSSQVSWLIMRAEGDAGFRDCSDLPAEMPPFKNLTVGGLYRWLGVMEGLWGMRRAVQAEVSNTKPFEAGAVRVAMIKGVPSEVTPVPPSHLALHLFEQSVSWVFTRSEALLAAIEIRDRSKLRADVVNMATACWIVIAAFSARRDREIDELTVDCLAGDDAGGWWLFVYIEKTLERKDWIPIPNVVARAVEVQKAISAGARRQGGNEEIFQWLDDRNRVTKLDVGERLDAFADIVGVPLHTPHNEPSRKWHWVPRQMRRFFAVLYFYRFDGATIEVLAHQLRHFSLETARGYVTQDTEVTQIWREAEIQYRSDFCRSVVTGSRAIGGKMGERIKRAARHITDQLRRKMQVVTPNHAASRLSAFMERELLVLSPLPWVTCSCPLTNDAARKAVCREGEVDLSGVKGPDRTRQGPLTCHSCVFSIIEGNRAPYVAAQVSHLERTVEAGCGRSTLFGDLERMNLVTLKSAYEEIYSTAEPLEPVFAVRDIQ
ncbi:hypothetical protein [Tardiphaga robiniae]|uniref:hypothetical protein n=1 Tax=Tardiphaga robiniae TaxID=943830 RepID=UPI001585E676|nr:hypothetical protein [Tardiphaga robiniae]NUU41858.1 hypothetical protein [Tardiphaga robiniae]